MDNQFIKQQCQNIKYSIQLFENACKLAATKDDGKISKDEEKILKIIKKANEKYLHEIEAVLK